MAKKILITGCSGFIGSHLCERLLNEGYEVHGIDNFLTSTRENIEHLLGLPNFHFYEYDVSFMDTSRFVELKPDIIMHLASPASPKDYYKYQIETMLVNSMGTKNMLDIAKQTGSRFLFASTSEIYGDPLVHPQREDYWGNVNPVGPRSIYDEAKRYGEAMTMAYRRLYGMDVRIVRIFNTYGPRMRIEDGRVVSNFIVQALKGEELTVYGDGSQTRSFCFVSDMIEGIYKVAFMEGLEGEIFNLGNPEEFRIIELANLVMEMIPSAKGIRFLPLPEDDPKRRKPDITKAKRILGWEPKVPLKQGLRKTIEYFSNKLKIS